jgi:hypothetical protein
MIMNAINAHRILMESILEISYLADREDWRITL